MEYTPKTENNAEYTFGNRNYEINRSFEQSKTLSDVVLVDVLVNKDKSHN